MRRLLLMLIIIVPLIAQCRVEPAVTSVLSATAIPATPTLRIGIDFATRTASTSVFAQVTPSPLPTETSTPTATPVVYTVVEGDTLLGIALVHGTTVEELKTLNPDALAGFLQIGQGLILPPLATPPPFSSGGTAVPLLLRVVDVQLLTTRSGALLVLGEVENQGEEAVENVQVSLALVGEQGGSIAEGRTWIAEPIIPQGKRDPLFFVFRQCQMKIFSPR